MYACTRRRPRGAGLCLGGMGRDNRPRQQPHLPGAFLRGIRRLRSSAMPTVPRAAVVLFPCLLASTCTALQAAALRSKTSVEHFALVRVEGTTELVGDLVITLEGGTPTAPGQPLPTVDMEVAVNTTVTSRPLDG